MADNTFKSNITSLMESVDGFLNTKTVVGDAVKVGNNVILPLAEISFGAGAGVFENAAKNRCGGGMGAKITPSAVLVINDSGTKMVSVKSSDGLGRIIDMVPDIAAKFMNRKSGDAGGESDFSDIPEADIDQEIDLQK